MADNGQQKRAFLDFLDQGDYMTHVDTMLKQRRTRLLLSLDELRTFDAELTRQVRRRLAGGLSQTAAAVARPLALSPLPRRVGLLKAPPRCARACTRMRAQVLRYPADHLPAFEEALREVVASQDPTFAKTQPLSALKVGLQGAFGANHVSPRGLGASLLNAAVCVEGIVTKCTQVHCIPRGVLTSTSGHVMSMRMPACVEGVATKCLSPIRAASDPHDGLWALRILATCTARALGTTGAPKGASLHPLLPRHRQVHVQGVSRPGVDWRCGDGFGLSHQGARHAHGPLTALLHARPLTPCTAVGVHPVTARHRIL